MSQMSLKTHDVSPFSLDSTDSLYTAAVVNSCLPAWIVKCMQVHPCHLSHCRLFLTHVFPCTASYCKQHHPTSMGATTLTCGLGTVYAGLKLVVLTTTQSWLAALSYISYSQSIIICSNLWGVGRLLTRDAGKQQTLCVLQAELGGVDSMECRLLANCSGHSCIQSTPAGAYRRGSQTPVCWRGDIWRNSDSCRGC